MENPQNGLPIAIGRLQISGSSQAWTAAMVGQPRYYKGGERGKARRKFGSWIDLSFRARNYFGGELTWITSSGKGGAGHSWRQAAGVLITKRHRPAKNFFRKNSKKNGRFINHLTQGKMGSWQKETETMCYDKDSSGIDLVDFVDNSNTET